MLKERNITLKDIAEMVGVSKAAISGVLNNSTKISCNNDKRKKIFELAEKYNYVPQSAARALSTRRTYQIGFMVSTKVTLGLANTYFSTLMAGAQHVCQQRDYLLTATVYDFSDIENFVIPKKLKQHSVDGVIIAGSTAPEVIELIQKFNIPFILFHDSHNIKTLARKGEQNNLVYLSGDNRASKELALKYLVDLGHRKIAIAHPSSHWESDFTDIKAYPGLELIRIADSVTDNFEYGLELAEKWLATPKAERYTAMCACDQVCCGFLSTLHESNVAECPADISLISGGETAICKWLYPKLTAIDNNAYLHGAAGASILIDVLDKKLSLDEARKEADKFYKANKLIIRDSCQEKA